MENNKLEFNRKVKDACSIRTNIMLQDKKQFNYIQNYYKTGLHTHEIFNNIRNQSFELKKKSYFIFKKRQEMKNYFSNVFSSLNKKGLFVVDIFGGSQCYDAIEDVHTKKKFTYYWDQVSYDPISNFALFYIHFRVNGKKVTKVFKYDWRMWSIPEVRDLMEEVGFKKTHVYWEGTTRKGEGDGKFKRTEKGESCLSWIAYIAAEK